MRTHPSVVDQAAQLAGEVVLQRLRSCLDALGARDIDGKRRQTVRVAGLLAQSLDRLVSGQDAVSDSSGSP